jgi:hypothetical protein
MLKNAYDAGWASALDRFDSKDAGLKQMLTPLALAAGIGGGGTGAAAAAHHLMPHHAPVPMAEPMALGAPTAGPMAELMRGRMADQMAAPVAAPMAPAAPMARQALPNFGASLQQERGRLDQILNAR